MLFGFFSSVLCAAPLTQQSGIPVHNPLNLQNKLIMNDQSFTVSLLVDQSPKEVFDAVNNVRGWWSEQIDGATDQLNSEFKYHYKDLHQCRMKITEMVPAKKVVWKVLDNYFSFTKDKTGQWKDSRIVFEISEKDGRTELIFTHVGLTPDEECYNVCFDAWTGYITKSLKSLITTGTGNPTKDDHSKFNDDIQKKWNG
jgi:hypothetical protein